MPSSTRQEGWREVGGGVNEERDWEGRRRSGERGWEVGGKWGVRENVGSEGINVIASHEYVETVRSGEEEEEERQISGEEGLKEITTERRSAGEEEGEGGDEGAVGGGELGTAYIIPDRVTTNHYGADQTVRWIQVTYVVVQ